MSRRDWTLLSIGADVVSIALVVAVVIVLRHDRPKDPVATAGKAAAKVEAKTIGDLSELYPVPFMGKSGWKLDSLDKQQREHEGRKDKHSQSILEIVQRQRQAAATELQKLDASARATARWYGKTIPYYSITRIMEHSDWVITCLIDHSALYDGDIQKEKIREYVKDIGGETEFKQRHPKQAWFLEMLNP